MGDSETEASYNTGIASAKSQSITFFKASLIENGAKIVQRRVVLLKYMFLLSLRTHESMEIQISTDGIHRM